MRKSIHEEAAIEYAYMLSTNAFTRSYLRQAFRRGVDYALQYTDVSDEPPPLYAPVIVKNKLQVYIAWRAVDDNGDDIYTIYGTNNVLKSPPECWRHINLL